MDDDIEGDDPPEYTPPTDRLGDVWSGVLALLLGAAFIFGCGWLADRIGGPAKAHNAKRSADR